MLTKLLQPGLARDADSSSQAPVEIRSQSGEPRYGLAPRLENGHILEHTTGVGYSKCPEVRLYIYLLT